jgi:YD repeat-containing protein
MTNATFQLNGSPVSGTPATIMANAINGANGPVSYTLGNGLSMDMAYDALGRISAKWLCHGNPSANCSQSSTVFATTATWQGQRLLASGNSTQGAYGSYG